jgi:hypothetical protein
VVVLALVTTGKLGESAGQVVAPGWGLFVADDRLTTCPRPIIEPTAMTRGFSLGEIMPGCVPRRDAPD